MLYSSFSPKLRTGTREAPVCRATLTKPLRRCSTRSQVLGLQYKLSVAPPTANMMLCPLPLQAKQTVEPTVQSNSLFNNNDNDKTIQQKQQQLVILVIRGAKAECLLRKSELTRQSCSEELDRGGKQSDDEGQTKLCQSILL